jgi:hypothetical protein
VTHPSAVDAVLQIGGREQRRRGDHHDAQLDRGQQRFPERHLVEEHQQEAVTLSGTPVVQEVRDAIRRGRELRERADGLRSILVDDVQGGAIVAVGDGVEVVERPVEPHLIRPPEPAHRGLVIGPVLEKEIAAGQERISGPRGGHTITLWIVRGSSYSGRSTQATTTIRPGDSLSHGE